MEHISSQKKLDLLHIFTFIHQISTTFRQIEEQCNYPDDDLMCQVRSIVTEYRNRLDFLIDSYDFAKKNVELDNN